MWLNSITAEVLFPSQKKKSFQLSNFQTFLIKAQSSTWCLKGLVAFSGVLHTEGVGSLGTKVCFDYVWKLGDSKGWDGGWDCSELSQPETGHCCATLAPGCCPTLRSTRSWLWETFDWAGAAAGMQLLSSGSCPHTTTAATQADFLIRN